MHGSPDKQNHHKTNIGLDIEILVNFISYVLRQGQDFLTNTYGSTSLSECDPNRRWSWDVSSESSSMRIIVTFSIRDTGNI